MRALSQNCIYGIFMVKSFLLFQPYVFCYDKSILFDNLDPSRKNISFPGTSQIKKKLYGPFLRIEPLRGGSLLFTTKFPEIPGTRFIGPERLSRPWNLNRFNRLCLTNLTNLML